LPEVTQYCRFQRHITPLIPYCFADYNLRADCR
jgi:hypothetical protein